MALSETFIQTGKDGIYVEQVDTFMQVVVLFLMVGATYMNVHWIYDYVTVLAEQCSVRIIILGTIWESLKRVETGVDEKHLITRCTLKVVNLKDSFTWCIRIGYGVGLQVSVFFACHAKAGLIHKITEIMRIEQGIDTQSIFL